ncbi:unnamed protein product [Arabis nemorensis]|uniref:Uncharacterized protein n=1 Tax=Arabis nemorensis TaxID=586526 RepID=A0A565BQS6_9BRAS|nr:unnamed protein product [Arabis nemorensis]
MQCRHAAMLQSSYLNLHVSQWEKPELGSEAAAEEYYVEQLYGRESRNKAKAKITTAPVVQCRRSRS